MAGHGGRLPSSVNGQSDDPGFVLPLSSNHLNGWRSLLTNLSPFVSRNSGRTFRVYARRLLAENSSVHDNSRTNIPPVGDRTHLSNVLGSWSSSRVHLGHVNNHSTLPNSQDNLVPISAPIHQNVVIDIEDSNNTEHHRRSPTPRHSDLNRHSNNSSTNAHSTHAHTVSDPVPEDGSVLPNRDSGESLPGSNRHGLISINGESITDILNRNPVVKNILEVIWQYFVFVLIIIAKVSFDKFASLLFIPLLFIGFIIANKVVRASVSCQERWSKRQTLWHLATLFAIPCVIYFLYNKLSYNFYYSAMLLPPDSTYVSLGDLLWTVIVTDLVLKLCTVFIKGVVTLLPRICFHFSIGKHLAMIEYASQLYRSLAPAQPWISYLLDNYIGIEKVFGVFLSAIYMFCKGPDIIFKVKNFHYVMKKIFQSSKYGHSPSKSQLEDIGNLCPICQDSFVLPTMLQCKHIFCEQCVERWFDRERTCPMCRTKVADDPTYRDGNTTFYFQLY